MNDQREAVFLGQYDFLPENGCLYVQWSSFKAVETGFAERHYPLLLQRFFQGLKPIVGIGFGKVPRMDAYGGMHYPIVHRFCTDGKGCNGLVEVAVRLVGMYIE